MKKTAVNKALSFLLVLVMMLSLMPISAFASGNAIIRVGSISDAADPGSEITIRVNIENNPGFSAGVLAIEYDAEVLEPSVRANGSAKHYLGSLFDVFTDRDGDYGYSVSQQVAAGSIEFHTIDGNITGDGEILVLKFKVKDNTTAKSTVVGLELKNEYEENFSNQSGGNVPVEFVSGTIAINGVTPPQPTNVAAYIGTTEYETLDAAMEATQTGDTVKLGPDWTQGDSPIIINKSITLDLNGKSVGDEEENDEYYASAAIIIDSNDALNVTITNTSTSASVINGNDSEPILVGAGGSAESINVRFSGKIVISAESYTLFNSWNCDNVSITIENGTYEGEMNCGSAGFFTINGGRFTDNFSNYSVPRDYILKEGCTLEEGEGADSGYYVVKEPEQEITYVAEANGHNYTSVEAAIQSLGSAGGTVKLLENCDTGIGFEGSGSSVSTSRQYTLDLNGKTVSAPNGQCAISVSNAAKLTVTSSQVGGKITSSANASDSATIKVKTDTADTSVTFADGNVSVENTNATNGNLFYLDGSSAKAIISAGTFSGIKLAKIINNGQVQISGGNFTVSGFEPTGTNGTIAITGGSFNIDPSDYVDSTTYHVTTDMETEAFVVGAHTIATHAAQAATCETAGWESYEYCTGLGCNYTTKVEIPALGHQYDDEHVTFTFSSDGKSATYRADCTREGCSHYETGSARVKGVITTPATFTENGVTTYTASVELSGHTYTGEVTKTDVPMLVALVTISGSPELGYYSADENHTLVETSSRDGSFATLAEALEYKADRCYNGNASYSWQTPSWVTRFPEHTGAVVQRNSDMETITYGSIDNIDLNGFTIDTLNINAVSGACDNYSVRIGSSGNLSDKGFYNGTINSISINAPVDSVGKKPVNVNISEDMEVGSFTASGSVGFRINGNSNTHFNSFEYVGATGSNAAWTMSYISGGTFDSFLYTAGKDDLNISGGTFIGFDPTPYVQNTLKYIVIRNGDTYTVEERGVFKVGQKGYSTFNEAVAAAILSEDKTVKLGEDYIDDPDNNDYYSLVNFNQNNWEGENPTFILDMNGKSIEGQICLVNCNVTIINSKNTTPVSITLNGRATSLGFFWVGNNSLTIDADNLSLYNTATNKKSPMFKNSYTSAPLSVEIKQGTFNIASDKIGLTSSNLTISGGAFTFDPSDYIDKTTYHALSLDSEPYVVSRHTISTRSAQAATCVDPGNTEYDYCSVAGCNYTSVPSEQYNIPALGHAYDADHVTFVWAEDGKSAKYTAECTRSGCGDVTELIDVDEVNSEVTTAATCTAKGTTTYTATVTLNETPYSNTTTRQDVDALGHDYVNHEAQAATCTEVGWDAYQTCGRTGCDYTTYSEIPALGHDLDDPVFTFSEDGTEATYTRACKRTGCTYKTEAQTATVSHSTKIEPTCNVMGTTTYTASVTIGDNTYTDSTERQDIPVLPSAVKIGDVNYATFADAYAAANEAKDGSVIVLKEDVSVIGTEIDALSINTCSIDLNGNTLTATSMFAVKGRVFDSSSNRAGTLVVDKDSYSVSNEYAEGTMPVWTGEGYKFVVMNSVRGVKLTAMKSGATQLCEMIYQPKMSAGDWAIVYDALYSGTVTASDLNYEIEYSYSIGGSSRGPIRISFSNGIVTEYANQMKVPGTNVGLVLSLRGSGVTQIDEMLTVIYGGSKDHSMFSASSNQLQDVLAS